MVKEKDLYIQKQIDYIENNIEVTNKVCIISRSLPEKRKHEGDMRFNSYLAYQKNLGNIEVIEVFDEFGILETVRVDKILRLTNVTKSMNKDKGALLDKYASLKEKRDNLFLAKIEEEKYQESAQFISWEHSAIHTSYLNLQLRPLRDKLNENWNLSMTPFLFEDIQEYNMFDRGKDYIYERFEGYDYDPEEGTYDRYNEFDDEYTCFDPNSLILEFYMDEKISSKENIDIYNAIKNNKYYGSEEKRKKEKEFIKKHIPIINEADNMNDIYYSEKLEKIGKEFNCEIKISSGVELSQNFSNSEALDDIRFKLSLSVYMENTTLFDGGVDRTIKILEEMLVTEEEKENGK